jgi:hypothetical protein
MLVQIGYQPELLAVLPPKVILLLMNIDIVITVQDLPNVLKNTIHIRNQTEKKHELLIN